MAEDEVGTVNKAECPDCGALMERWNDNYRCPWSRVTSARVLAYAGRDFVFNCGRPYKRGTELVSPITGRMRQ